MYNTSTRYIMSTCQCANKAKLVSLMSKGFFVFLTGKSLSLLMDLNDLSLSTHKKDNLVYSFKHPGMNNN